MIDLIKKLGFKTINQYIEKLLSHSQTGVYEIKQIIYNAINRYIDFVIHFYKPKPKGNKLLSYLRDEFNLGNKIPFPSNFKISVKTALFQDITQQVVCHETLYLFVNLEKLIQMEIKDFVIQARGPFKIDIHDIIYAEGRNRPAFEDEMTRRYVITVIFYRANFITENLFLMDIPLELEIPLSFIDDIYLSKELEYIRNYLERVKTNRRKEQVFKDRFQKSMGFPFEHLGEKVKEFMTNLQKRVQERFIEFISIENQKNLAFSNVILISRTIFGDFPKLAIRASIPLDYREESDKVTEITVDFKKDVFYKIASKVWRITRSK